MKPTFDNMCNSMFALDNFKGAEIKQIFCSHGKWRLYVCVEIDTDFLFYQNINIDKPEQEYNFNHFYDALEHFNKHRCGY